MVSDWLQRGLPCIFARQQSQHPAQVRVGLPLKMGTTLLRVGMEINAEDIARESPLPQLNQVIALPEHPPLGKSIHVYGSFLWQYLAKELHVRADSDLDVLIYYQDQSLMHLCQQIDYLTQKTKRTIDGELRFNGVGDIGIGELINPHHRTLLVKTTTSIHLLAREALYEHHPTLSK